MYKKFVITSGQPHIYLYNLLKTVLCFKPHCYCHTRSNTITVQGRKRSYINENTSASVSRKIAHLLLHTFRNVNKSLITHRTFRHRRSTRPFADNKCLIVSFTFQLAKEMVFICGFRSTHRDKGFRIVLFSAKTNVTDCVTCRRRGIFIGLSIICCVNLRGRYFVTHICVSQTFKHSIQTSRG